MYDIIKQKSEEQPMNTGATFEVHSITDLDIVDKFYSFVVNSFEDDDAYLAYIEIPEEFDYEQLFKELHEKDYISSYVYKKIEYVLDNLFDNEGLLFLSDEQYFALAVGVPLPVADHRLDAFWKDHEFREKTFGFLYHIIESVFNMTDIETKAEIMEEFYDDACESMDEEYEYNGGYKIPYLEKPDLDIFSTYMSNNAIAEIENALNECLEIVDDGDILKDLLTKALNKVTTP